MKPIIIDMKDLSESTEIYEKKPNPAVVSFLYILLGIIVIAVLWMAFSEIDIVTECNGVFLYGDGVTEVTCDYNAKITKCNVTDGEYVTEGTVLYELRLVGSDKDSKKEDQTEEAPVIRAEESGYFYTSLDGGTGLTLEAESCVGYLFPTPQKTFQAQIFILSNDIGKVTEGQQVLLETTAFPASEYGVITGFVRKISETIQYGSESGISYCYAWVEIDMTELTDGKGKSIPLKNGLFCQAKIITDKKKVLPYVWEKLR